MHLKSKLGETARGATAALAGTAVLVLTLAALLSGRALAADCLNKPLTNGNVCITSFRTEPIGGQPGEMTATVDFQSTIGTQWNVVFATTGPGGTLNKGNTISQGGSASGSAQQTVPYKPGVAGPPYQVQVQECLTLNVPPQPLTTCSDWALANFTPPAPPTGLCPPGEVAKGSQCVTPPPPPCPKGQVVRNGQCVAEILNPPVHLETPPSTK